MRARRKWSKEGDNSG